MGYYDDDEESYNGYVERIEPVSLVAESCTDKDITYALLYAGLINDKAPRLICSMEKLVFVYGNSNEVYSSMEIRFTEQVDHVLVYSDFYKSMNKGNMACRTIAAKINFSGHDALKACVSFEKIVDKALDGFNIFFFVTEDSVFWGSRIFDKTGKSDCCLSMPVCEEWRFEQIQEEISCYAANKDFLDFYYQYRGTVASGCKKDEYYEDVINKRKGMQFSYLEDIDNIGREFGVDLSNEKDRYRRMFERDMEISFDDLFEEIKESLSFIKSNRVNTYEMLFEADEMMRQAEAAEEENDRLAIQAAWEFSDEESEQDAEAEALLDDPEEMIKLLKKRRGL